MFCKICFDAGRTDYTTHNIRDSARNTICPYLLSIKCRNCGYTGHTASYCKIKKVCHPVKKPVVVKHIDIPKPKPINMFTALLCDEDEDEEDIIEELPPVSNIVWGQGFKDSVAMSWGDAVVCV